MQVPFHPDESTQLFNSYDVETFLKDPLSMAWEPTVPLTTQMRYRMLDAPLTRYFIGIGRFITGHPPQTVDWDWSKSWEENSNAGALPDTSALFVARLSVAWVFPLSLLLFWHLLSMNFGKLAGWIGIAFLAGNSLILLHTRRSMAESLTVFFVIFCIWAIFFCKKHPWLIALPVSLAFNAKQSTAIWLLIGFMPILFNYKYYLHHKLLGIKHLSLYAIFVIGVFFLLNPFAWKHPFQSLQEAFFLRQDLVAQQLADIIRVSPQAALTTPLQRISGIVANLFFTTPAPLDTANYQVALSDQVNKYLSIPINSFMRNFLGGSILLIFSLTGMYSVIRGLVGNQKREEILIILAGVLQFILLVFTVPIPFQRYVMPLVPIVIFFFAIGFSNLISLFFQFSQIRKLR
jgi:4-amino-4-deoxy-L-arabinose transferase-like glycosyltransferase